MKKTAKKKSKKRKLSPEEKKQASAQRRFRLSINTLFKNVGFDQIATRDVAIDFEGQKGDIDALFYYKNIVVISEDTCSDASSKDHVNKTGIFYQHLADNKDLFIEYLSKVYPNFKSSVTSEYSSAEIEVRFIYCSTAVVEERHFSNHPILKPLPNRSIRYFLALSRTIHKSGIFELLKFLGINLSAVGPQAADQKDYSEYPAFVLPETPSGFPHGYKVVSFYADPKSIIERAYVLRKDSWQDGDSLYQRMLVSNKIKSMRQYLAVSKRVYINNIVASLPNSAQFFKPGDDRSPVTLADIKKVGHYKVVLPQEFDCIGIIDGQHRLFSYYEGDDQYETEIARRRVRQQLLITGIIFPSKDTAEVRAKFEANLFLEINDKQSRAKAHLKQAIETITAPFTPIALAKSIISRMAVSGPLAGFLEEHYFDQGTIKTSSIVSYGLRHIVAINEQQPEGLYNHWKHANKNQMRATEDVLLRKSYIDFCATHLNILISGFKANIPNDKWTTKRSESRALTTTTINGLIFCFKSIIDNSKVLPDFDDCKKAFSKMKLDFRPDKFPYKSSHWRALGDDLYNDCFR